MAARTAEPDWANEVPRTCENVTAVLWCYRKEELVSMRLPSADRLTRRLALVVVPGVAALHACGSKDSSNPTSSPDASGAAETSSAGDAAGSNGDSSKATDAENDRTDEPESGVSDMDAADATSDRTNETGEAESEAGDTDKCAVGACLDSGICVDGSDGDSCTCVAGFPGPTCNGIGDARSCAGANPGALAWAKAAASGPDYSLGTSIASLPDGSSFVAGSFQGSSTFGTGEPKETTLIALGSVADQFVAKYDPLGELVWVTQIGSASVGGITALSDGSVLVTGGFLSSATFAPNGANQVVLTTAGGGDAFVVKYTAAGKLAWVSQVRSISGGGAKGRGIAALPDSSVVVTGEFLRSTTFGAGEPNETTMASAGDYNADAFVAKYATDGKLVWATRATGSSSGVGVEGLPDGSALVTGSFGGGVTFGAGEAHETKPANAGNGDMFTARYSADGKLVWVRSAGGSADDGGFGIAALPDGTALVTGSFQNTAIFGAGEANETTLASVGGHDAFLAQYAPDGSFNWVKQIGGTGNDIGYGVAAQRDGLVLVTGYFGNPLTLGAGESNATTLMIAGDTDVFVAQYTRTGLLTWAKSAGGLRGDVGYGVAALQDGSAIVTGQINSTPSPGGVNATFGSGEPNQTTINGTGSGNMFVAKFQSCTR